MKTRKIRTITWRRYSTRWRSCPLTGRPIICLTGALAWAELQLQKRTVWCKRSDYPSSLSISIAATLTRNTSRCSLRLRVEVCSLWSHHSSNRLRNTQVWTTTSCIRLLHHSSRITSNYQPNHSYRCELRVSWTEFWDVTYLRIIKVATAEAVRAIEIKKYSPKK